MDELYVERDAGSGESVYVSMSGGRARPSPISVSRVMEMFPMKRCRSEIDLQCLIEPIYEELKPRSEFFSRLEKEIRLVQESVVEAENDLYRTVYSVPKKATPIYSVPSSVATYSVPRMRDPSLHYCRSEPQHSTFGQYRTSTSSGGGSDYCMTLSSEASSTYENEPVTSDDIVSNRKQRNVIEINAGTVAGRVKMFDTNSRQNGAHSHRHARDDRPANRVEAAHAVRELLESKYSNGNNRLATIRRSQPLCNIYKDYVVLKGSQGGGESLPTKQPYTSQPTSPPPPPATSRPTSLQPPSPKLPPPLPLTKPEHLEHESVEVGTAVLTMPTNDPLRVVPMGAINRRLQQHRSKQQQLNASTRDQYHSFKPTIIYCGGSENGGVTDSSVKEKCDTVEGNQHNGRSDLTREEVMLKDMSHKIEQLMRTIDRQTRCIDTMQLKLDYRDERLKKTASLPRGSTYQPFDLSNTDSLSAMDFDCKDDGYLTRDKKAAVKRNPVLEEKKWKRKILSCIR